MSERLFVKFVEENEWEGETWCFYIPIDGNGDALMDLEEAISDLDGFVISDKYYTEDEVDLLVSNTDTGYIDLHNKLDGVLNIDELYFGDVTSKLYKGGLRKLIQCY